jgi:hypothetical protein
LSRFVAFAVEGSYDVLSIVDQTHLPGIVVDKLTGVVLGWTHEVKMKSRVGHGQEKDYVVALLFVPSSFSAVLPSHALAASTFLQAIVPFCSVEMTWNSLAPGNQ